MKGTIGELRSLTQIVLALALVFSFFASPALAQVYRYTDKDGRQHYVSSTDKVPAQYRSQLDSQKPLPPINRADFPISEKLAKKGGGGLLGLPSGLITGNSPSIFVEPKASTQAEVEIYVTAWCPYCVKLENYLNQRKIKYTKFDIEKNSQGKKKYQALGGAGVPLSKVGGKVIVGFNPQAIEAALN